MKKLFSLLTIILLLSCNSAFAMLWTGVYRLTGSNDPSGVVDYTGEVIIRRQGENYSVIRNIYGFESEVGIGILNQGGLFHNDVLSVAFCDLSGGIWGVISYEVVSGSVLDGKWAKNDSETYGIETLIWKSY